MNLKQILKHLFGQRTRYYCAFCRKAHDQVANLIEGSECCICNECVLICSGVLMKECEEYRKHHLDKVIAVRREEELRWLKKQHQLGQLSDAVYLERQRDVLREGKKTDGAAPNGGAATPLDNPGAEGPPSVS